MSLDPPGYIFHFRLRRSKGLKEETNFARPFHDFTLPLWSRSSTMANINPPPQKKRLLMRRRKQQQLSRHILLFVQQGASEGATWPPAEALCCVKCEATIVSCSCLLCCWFFFVSVLCWRVPQRRPQQRASLFSGVMFRCSIVLGDEGTTTASLQPELAVNAPWICLEMRPERLSGASSGFIGAPFSRFFFFHACSETFRFQKKKLGHEKKACKVASRQTDRQTPWNKVNAGACCHGNTCSKFHQLLPLQRPAGSLCQIRTSIIYISIKSCQFTHLQHYKSSLPCLLEQGSLYTLTWWIQFSE